MLRISPRTVPVGLGAVVDQGAVHQEQGLGNRAHHVFVGDRGIDAEETVDQQSRPTRALDGAGFLATCAVSPVAAAAFLDAPLVRLGPAARLGSPRLKFAWAFLAFLPCSCPGRPAWRVDGVAVASRRAAPAPGRGHRRPGRRGGGSGSSRRRSLARLVGRRANASLISLGVEDGAEQPTDVIASLSPLVGQGIEHLGPWGSARGRCHRSARRKSRP